MPRPTRRSILGRFVIVSLFAFFISATAAIIASSLYNSADILAESKDIVDIAAGETRLALDGLTYDDLISTSGKSKHAEIRSSLKHICSLLNIRYLYVYDMKNDYELERYLFAVASNNAADRMLTELAAENYDFLPHGFKQEQSALAGKTESDPEVITTEFGKNLIWCYPLRIDGHDDPLVMRIEIDDAKVNRSIFDNTLSFAIPMIVINLLAALFEVGMLHRGVSEPLRILSTRMRGFVQNGPSRSEPLAIGSNDEISEIADSYNKMTSDIVRYVDKIETMTQERVATDTELSVAQRIQLGMVPPTKRLEGNGFETYACMRMARTVGGDFYHLSTLDDGRLLFVLGDVSGKGISAAFFMAMGLTLIYDKLEMCCDPAEALNQANDIIVQNNPANMFVTLAAGLFDPQSGMLTYANAGHTPPLLIGKGYENPDQGIALGLFEDAGIVNETIHLDPGDGMLFYTDGATEANNADRAFFGEERLAAAVCGATCPADAVSAAVDAVEAFVEDCEQFDDLTLLSIFAREPEVVDPKTVWEDSTKPDTLYLEVLRQHLLPCFETKEQGLKAMLACDEVFTNIAMYSDATIVDVQIQQDEHEVRIRFSDDGVPFDPVSSEPEDCDFEDLDIGGMGIQLVRQTCSDMSYERLDDRNILTLHFAR